MWTVRMRGVPVSGYVALSINGKAYSLHSYQRGKPIDMSVFDPASYRWDLVQTQPLPDGGPMKIGGYTVAAYGESAYLWGGLDDGESDNALYRLDTNTMTWSRPEVSGEVPRLLSHHSACLVGHRMYTFGGLARDLSQHVQFLDLDTMNWHRVPTSGETPRCRIHHRACAIGSRMYVWGGLVFGARGNYVSDNSVYYLETATATWVRPHLEGASPEGRFSYSPFVHKGEMYILGGYHWHHFAYMREIHKYNPDNTCWTLVTPRGSGPCAGAINRCCMVGDRVIVFNVRQRTTGAERLQISPFIIDGESVTDIHVLDFAPTLRTLCLVACTEARLESGRVPPILMDKISPLMTDGSSSHPS